MPFHVERDDYNGQQAIEFQAQLREGGLEPNVVHRFDDNGTVLGLVAVDAGVALVPRIVAESANSHATTIELDERLPPRRVGLSWAERPSPSARARCVGGGGPRNLSRAGPSGLPLMTDRHRDASSCCLSGATRTDLPWPHHAFQQ